MSKAIRPVVRTLIACEQIQRDPDVRNRLTLVWLIHAIRPEGDERYPLIRPKFAVLAVVTNGRGAGEVWIEMRYADTDQVCYHSRRLPVRFPADPLQVCAMTFEVRNIVFASPGLYTVQLWFDGEVLADYPIVAR